MVLLKRQAKISIECFILSPEPPNNKTQLTLCSEQTSTISSRDTYSLRSFIVAASCSKIKILTARKFLFVMTIYLTGVELYGILYLLSQH
jgi:hypothetical protein